MKRLLQCLVCMVLVNVGVTAQIQFDLNTLQQRREQVRSGEYATAYKNLIKEADWLLTLKPLSVMDKQHVARTGDKHDYYSLNYYAWPDETRPDGRPYITIDCKPNPAYKEYDYENMLQMSNRVERLTLAWYFSGDERYAAKAVEQIRVWFINPTTCMNPNMDYCQVVPGTDNDLGRSVLDGTCVATAVNAASLLALSRSFKKSDQKRLKAWVADFHVNIANNKGGRWCDGLENNIAVAYDYQRIVYWLYCGKRSKARSHLRTFPERRLFKQLTADGSQPLELKRPNAFSYSWYNLHWLTNVYLIASIQGMDISWMQAANGATYYKAVDFLMPYMGRGREAWPYQETSEWLSAQSTARRDLYRISRVLNDKYQSAAVLSEGDLYNLCY